MAEKKIGGRTVRYDRLPGDQALDLMLRLLQLLGEGDTLLEAVLTADEGESDKLAIVGLLKFAKNMNVPEVKGFILEMVGHCMVDGVEPTPGMMDLQEIIQTAQFAIKTEFGGFFADGAGSVLLKAAKA
ncbi:phage tail assembly chaperone [Bosea sp. UC22_33]|uniref:phage tail assembly chaperone n=1 Tax=Bosea sp. UC22_33 TaxID=3350165 RepID=UPI00366B1519